MPPPQSESATQGPSAQKPLGAGVGGGATMLGAGSDTGHTVPGLQAGSVGAGGDAEVPSSHVNPFGQSVVALQSVAWAGRVAKATARNPSERVSPLNDMEAPMVNGLSASEGEVLGGSLVPAACQCPSIEFPGLRADAQSVS
jgi:hypothetical protein